MKILILSTMTNGFGKKGLYHSQEIGLARGLASLGHNVEILKSVIDKKDKGTEQIEDSVIIRYIPCLYFNSNGYIPKRLFDKDASLLIQFADIQMSVPYIYHWCKKNDVVYIPYIGTICSQNINCAVKKIIDFLAKQNIRIYKNGCVAKTESARYELEKHGVSCDKIEIAPVCLDVEQLNQNFMSIDKNILKKKWGYLHTDKIYLFIGRFNDDKRPVDMVSLFSKCTVNNAKLIMVGRGNLMERVNEEIRNTNQENRIKIVEYVPHNNIWELYHISDVFVNLNHKEIWGMSIMEAMYYRVGVIAIDAPGPSNILIHSDTGYIANNDEDVVYYMNNPNFSKDMLDRGADRTKKEFNWKKSAELFLKVFNRS